MFQHFQLIAAVMLALAATTLAASIGLLKRENWARRLFIVLMALGIVANGLSLILQQVLMSEIVDAGAPADFRQQMLMVRAMMFVASLTMTIALSALFWWIIRKLRSTGIVAEFGRVGGPLTP